MKRLAWRTLILSLAVTLGTSALAAVASQAQNNARTFAMLPLVAGDTGVPYQVHATHAERTSFGHSIAAQIRASDGGIPIADARIARALAHAGIDQETPYHACTDAVCARRIGRAVGADTVLFGSVTRALAMIWGSEVSIVDVATGRVQGPYDLGYKGDFITLEAGVGELAHAVSNRLIADSALRNRNRAMARR